MNKLIGKNIRYYRKLRGRSQLWLAKKLGYYDSATISYLENAKRIIKAIDLFKIAGLLNVDINNFFMEVQDEYSRKA